MPRRADLLEELAEPVEPGHRREVAFASRRPPPAPAGPRIPSIRRMSASACRALESIASSASRASAGPPVERALRRPGLDDDHADVVGDDVVELARDPLPLLGDRQRGPLPRAPRSARAARSSTVPMYRRRSCAHVPTSHTTNTVSRLCTRPDSPAGTPTRPMITPAIPDAAAIAAGDAHPPRLARRP